VDLSKPHDSLFRFAFEDEEQARVLLRALLMSDARYCAIAGRIDWSRLQRLDDQFADAADRPFATDLWFSAPIGDSHVLIHVILDHKSSPDAMSAWQVTRYTVRSVESVHRTLGRPPRLPIVLPMIVYHGDVPWTPARNVRELFDLPTGLTRAEQRALRRLLPSLHYGLHDLAQVGPTVEGGDREGLVARLAIHFLCHMRNLSADQIAPALSRIRELLIAVQEVPRGRLLLGMLFSYLRATAKADVAQIYAAVRQALPTPTGNTMMNPLERAFEEATNRGLSLGIERGMSQGLSQGLSQGMSQGLSQGISQVLRRILTKRFGPLSPAVEARLQSATTQQLDAWTDRVLDAQSIEEALLD
jgi:phage baseplate assembly protein W